MINIFIYMVFKRERILRNRFNDLVLDELDDEKWSPFRTLVLLRMAIHLVPHVGQLRRLVRCSEPSLWPWR